MVGHPRASRASTSAATAAHEYPVGRLPHEGLMRSRFAAHAAKKARRAQLLERAPRVSPTIERAHIRDVLRVVRAFHALIGRALTPQLRQDIDWRSFKDKAREMSEAFRATAFQTAKRLERFSKSEAVRTLGDLASDLSDTVSGFAENFAADAVAKLGGLLESSLDAAENAMADAIATGAEEAGTFTLEGLLEGWLSRSAQSATNQVTQASAELNQARQVSAGVTTYVWLANHDDRVRAPSGTKHYGWHLPLDGQVCNWDDPPLTADKSSSGEPCHPGDDYNCRCMASPTIPEESAGDEEAETGAGEDAA